jgi:UDP-glucose 4-epimerase
VVNGLRVAVTGSTGVVGGAIAAALAAAGHAVTRLTRADFDLARPGAGAPDLSGVDALVHAAGITEESARGPDGATIAGAGWASLAARARAAGVARLVYVSSAHVYGPLEGRIDEAAPPDPRSRYAELHLESERVARDAGPACDVLRPCNVYGMPADLKRFARWALIPYAFPREAATRGRIVLNTPGLQARNFVAAQAVGAAAAALLALPPAAWRVRNVAGGDTLSVRDFARRVAGLAPAAIGTPVEVVVPLGDMPAPAPLDYVAADGVRAGDLDGFLAGMLRACRDLKDGWTA